MTKAKTPKNGQTTETGSAKMQGLTPVCPRRPFGSRPALSIRNSTRWYYQPRITPKS